MDYFEFRKVLTIFRLRPPTLSVVCTRAQNIENNLESREGIKIRGVLLACVRSAGKSTSVQ